MIARRKSTPFLKRLFFILFAACLGVGLALAAMLYVLIVLMPGNELKLQNIQKILTVESPVYYRDGLNKIGVFFQEQHRQYVPYEEIPKNFVNAIVAAEDHEFFSHHGVDFKGIFRAMIANIKAGRVVQGGSTLTQQTAKNLFKRRDRSLASKFKELLYAWRLEDHYSKERILEFYANQFYVSGNGRGLGVAALYYFDKPVDQLSLLECAFIAGSVKRPSAYNPFIKQSEEKERQAMDLARERTSYVIRQMYQLGMISKEQYAETLEQPVPFKQGTMSYSFNAIMDQVKIALGEPVVEEALSRHGIDNVATSGIRIITTIDRDLQQDSQFALRKELSRLDIRLSGYSRREVQKRYNSLTSVADRPVKGGFAMGNVTAIEGNGEESEVRVSFGSDENAPVGAIDYHGLRNALVPLVRFARNRWSEADRQDLALLLKELRVGDRVYVSVRGQDQQSGTYLLDLEKYPDLQGGALVLEDGIIRAMVGGFDNRNYNRAIYAKRPLGSVFKPLVYLAAQQLGWSSIDPLRNARDLFVYFDQPYFPRPDHESPYEYVSMEWAGVMSENVATVWLLYHLCDQLNPAQFKEIVDFLKLSRQPGESYASYSARIRDKYGLVVNRDRLLQAAYSKVVAGMEADLVFDGRIREYETLRQLYYSLPPYKIEDDPKDPDETQLRRRLMKKDFSRLLRMKKNLEADNFFINDEAEEKPVPLYLAHRYDDNGKETLAVFSESLPGEGWQQLDWNILQTIRQESNGRWDDLLLEGLLPVSLVDSIAPLVSQEYQKLSALQAYDPEVLYQIRDFRVLVGLHYLIGLCRSLGIESDLDPVLSFPLGSNVISLFEAAKAYEGIMRSEVVLSQAQEEGAELYLIDRIENSDGEVLYQPERLVRKVTEPALSLSVTDILRNVVRYGTGRLADQDLRLHSRDPEKEQYLSELDLRVPAFGKTGTANDFTNSAFVGFLPAPLGQGNRLSLEKGYVISCYVGYDDNRPMVRGSSHITGAAGALPIWVRIAGATVKDMDFASNMDVADLSFAGFDTLPVELPDLGQIEVPVDPGNGGTDFREEVSANRIAGGGPKILTFGKKNYRNEIEPKRFFAPYWQSRLP
jgi:penicillin-binding protein 1A